MDLKGEAMNIVGRVIRVHRRFRERFEDFFERNEVKVFYVGLGLWIGFTIYILIRASMSPIIVIIEK